MDLTYLVVAVLGMCAARPCRSLPTAAAATAAAAAAAAGDPAPTPSEPAPADNGKRSRSLQFGSPHPYHHLRGTGVDVFDGAMFDDQLQPLYVPEQQQQHQHQHQQQPQQPPPYAEDAELRAAVADDGDDGGYGGADVDQDLRSAARARPKPDSPVYYIRLPPQPYVYVPGYGYMSQPTRLEPPPFVQRPHSPFLNLPLGYVSNAKPVGVYTLPQQRPHGGPQHQYQHHQQQHQQQQQQQQFPGRPKPPQRRPPPTTEAPPPQHRPDSPVYNLDKGPYVFNGRPSDVFLLQSAYDNLYSEVLQNIYP